MYSSPGPLNRSESLKSCLSESSKLLLLDGFPPRLLLEVWLRNDPGVAMESSKFLLALLGIVESSFNLLLLLR